MTNADKLRAILTERSLSQIAVAKMLGVSVETVRGWLCRPGATRHRRMPDAMLRLLELEIKGPDS